jgi:hypothetical protein
VTENLAGIRISTPHVHLAWVLVPFIWLFSNGTAYAEIATPEQKRACTPDVYRFCAGEIPNVHAITLCLRRAEIEP